MSRRKNESVEDFKKRESEYKAKRYAAQKCWREANIVAMREHWRLRDKKYRAEKPERGLVYSAKSRAKRLGLPFNLEHGDIAIPAVCPVLGIPLVQNAGSEKGGPRDNSPTLDRVRPELGYVKGNVRVISSRANTIKSNATARELALVLHYVETALAEPPREK
jgi:hypothetical protein